MAKFEVTEEQLAAMVNKAVEEKIASMPAQPKAFVDASPNEQFNAMMRDRRGLNNAPLKTEVVKGVRSNTESTFDAKIDHNGRVVELLNYTHPEGLDKHVTEGGRIPHGFPLTGELYKQHVWENYRQADINFFVGRPLPMHLRSTREVTA